LLALVAIGSVAYGFNITQRKEPEQQEQAAATATARAAPSKTAELYANSEKRPTRVWPTGSPENPLTKVIYWRKAPYVLMKRGGWMRMYGMQPGRAGKVEIILEARGGNQYLLEVPLKQVKPWDLQFMNALFNSIIDWEATLQPYGGKIKNRDTSMQ